MLDLHATRSCGAASDPKGSGAVVAHRAARLPGGLVLIEMELAVPAPAGAVELLLAGAPLPPPTTAMLFGDEAAPRLFFAARDAGALLRPGTAVGLRRGGIALGGFRLDAPVAPAPLLTGRPLTERAALLRFLAATCAPLFGVAEEVVFAAALHALAEAVARDAGRRATAQPLCRPGATLSLWAAPCAVRGTWWLVERQRLRRIGPAEAGTLAIDGAAPAPGALLLPPSGAAPLDLAAAGPRLPALRDFLARGFRAAPGTIAARAVRALAGSPRRAALLREAQLMAPAKPWRALDPVAPVGGALELALSDGAGGLFLCGWTRDPLDLVAGMELRCAFGRQVLPTAALRRVARPDLAGRFAEAAFGAGGPAPGFVAHLPDADHAAVAQWRLGLRLASGEAIELVAPPSRLAPAAARDLVLRAVRPAALRPGVLEDAIAPAAWRLHRAAMAAPGTPEVVHLGTAPRRPALALVVPLYRNLRFLRAQLGAFLRDAALDGAEIAYVLDSPEQRAEVEHLLRGVVALHRRGATLVVMPANRGYASACNAGAAATAAPVIGFLNSDVIPAARGWAAPLLARLRRERRLAAVGPKLLFDDGTIQHAGLLFRLGFDGQWLNDHYWKGHPRGTLAAAAPRRVPAVTGAAIFVRRAAFDAAGGFCTDYVIGDFEDSDLCLALREAGHEIGYEPVELYHFERQSIGAHAGHSGSLAGACNRLLHHRRWDGAIAALMARFGEEG